MNQQQKKLPWLKWWRGTVTDPKLQLVAYRSGCPAMTVIGCWALCLEHCNDDGWIILNCDEPKFDDLQTLFCAVGKIMESEAVRLIDLLESQGLIHWEEGMGWTVIKFRERQLVDPGARERMRRKRERDQALN